MLHNRRRRWGATIARTAVFRPLRDFADLSEKVGSAAEGDKVVDAMKATPYDDPLFGPTKIRVDGRAVPAMYLAEVKKLSESKGPYDYFKILTTIPADQAFRPLAEEKGVCSLVQQVSETGH